jgi:hypothetical protein
METVKTSEADLDLHWVNGMKWPRDSAERTDWDVTMRMIRSNSNFYGLRHLQPLREFLEEVADGG